MPMDALPAAPPDPTLAHALRALLQARTGAPVALIETHVSWVLLTRRSAWKLKKPVRLAFLDFSTVALRKHYCDEELRLNRRLAPALYRAVVAVRGSRDAPRLGGPGESIDHLVCMRRFPDGALLSERAAAGLLEPWQVEQLARRLAAFHRTLPPAPAAAPVGRPRQILRAVSRSMGPLAGRVDADVLSGLRRWIADQASLLREPWSQRRRLGFVRECHGDLHLANAACIGADVVAFDCLEFDPALRWIDVMSDVAFPAMDLHAHGRADLAFDFVDTWLQASGDYEGVQVLRFYAVYRALVRAMVCVLQSRSAARDYIACALRWSAGRGARLLITHGLSGSGKSTLAARLLQRAGAIRVRSDVERKRLFGLASLQRSGDGAVDIYTPEATVLTFARLQEVARLALAAGFPVIVDAAFLRRAERDAFRDLAAQAGVPFAILDCEAEAGVLAQRIRRRAEAGGDPSEATLAVLQRQLATREGLDADEARFAIGVDTDADVDTEAVYRRWLAVPVPGLPRGGRAE